MAHNILEVRNGSGQKGEDRTEIRWQRRISQVVSTFRQCVVSECAPKISPKTYHLRLDQSTEQGKRG